MATHCCILAWEISSTEEHGRPQSMESQSVGHTYLVAQMVKRLSTMWETWVQSLSWEDPLEKEMVIHSSTIAWKIPWTEEPGRLQSIRLQRVRRD